MRVVAGKLRGVCRECAEDSHVEARADSTAAVEREPAEPHADGEAAETEPARAPRSRSWRAYAVGLAAAVALAVAATQIGETSPAPAALTAVPVQAAGIEPHAQAYASRTETDLDGPAGQTRVDPSDDSEPNLPDLPDEDGIEDGVEVDDEGIAVLVPESLPPTLEDEWEDTGEPIEERLPALADWVFPVLGSKETFPLRASRRFGARREGKRVARCGRGHCGVDLEGKKGTPVVAVAFGQVTRIEHGTHKRSGRYVRVEHPDYVYTSYMHLDRIADGLRVGDEVEPGTVLGTVGRTGVKESAPHLHFSLEVPIEGRLKHVDPVPFLKRASFINDPSEAYETPADE